jgi:hypothetical protein
MHSLELESGGALLERRRRIKIIRACSEHGVHRREGSKITLGCVFCERARQKLAIKRSLCAREAAPRGDSIKIKTIKIRVYCVGVRRKKKQKSVLTTTESWCFLSGAADMISHLTPSAKSLLLRWGKWKRAHFCVC